MLDALTALVRGALQGLSLAACVALAACSGPSVRVRGEELGQVRKLFVLIGQPKDFQDVVASDSATIERLLDIDRLGNYTTMVQFTPDPGPPVRWIERYDTCLGAGVEIGLADGDSTVEIDLPKGLAEKGAIDLAVVLHTGSRWTWEHWGGATLVEAGKVSLRVRDGRLEAGD